MLMPKKPTVNFEVSISGRDDGTVEAIYVKFLSDAVAKTVEVEQDGSWLTTTRMRRCWNRNLAPSN